MQSGMVEPAAGLCCEQASRQLRQANTTPRGCLELRAHMPTHTPPITPTNHTHPSRRRACGHAWNPAHIRSRRWALPPGCVPPAPPWPRPQAACSLWLALLGRGGLGWGGAVWVSAGISKQRPKPHRLAVCSSWLLCWGGVGWGGWMEWWASEGSWIAPWQSVEEPAGPGPPQSASLPNRLLAHPQTAAALPQHPGQPLTAPYPTHLPPAAADPQSPGPQTDPVSRSSQAGLLCPQWCSSFVGPGTGRPHPPCPPVQ